MSFEKIQRLLHRTADRITEFLIYGAVIFGPWAFGTTQPWSTLVMDGVGLALGLLWLGKLFLRAGGYTPPRWSTDSDRRVAGWLAAGTCCILAYCLISAWNARAIYHPEQWSFEYRDAIPWLPHSYDQDTSWQYFWEYLGLAGLFWGVRDWLLTLSPKEAARRELEGFPSEGDSRIPIRLRRLFWVLAINGTLLAIQGLMQRVEGGNKLLWLVVPRYDKDPITQFGPYAYRANAAQYFNLLWPAVLGFWWAGTGNRRRRRSSEFSARPSRGGALLPCVLLMAICPLVAASRGGVMVLVVNLIMSVAILLTAQWRRHWGVKALVLILLAGVVGGGALVGWKTLAPRMELIREGFAEREGLYIAGRHMALDNAVFGAGPGTFGSMYQLYRPRQTDEWLAFMHNDWLETVITFGWVGAIPIFLTLLLVLARWFIRGGLPGDKYFVMLLWVALGGCMAHGCFDFPFQIHSVLALFLVLCAVLSCLSRRPAASG